MKNWMTSLAGIAFGALNLYANGMNGKQVLVSAAATAIGLAAKDQNVTGGTKQQ